MITKRRLAWAVLGSAAGIVAWLAASTGAAQYPRMPPPELQQQAWDPSQQGTSPPQPEAWRPMPAQAEDENKGRGAPSPELEHFDYYVGGYDRYYGDDWFFDFYSFDPDAGVQAATHSYVEYDYSLGVFSWEELGVL